MIFCKKHKGIDSLAAQKIRRRSNVPITPKAISIFKFPFLLFLSIGFLGKKILILLRKVFTKIPLLSYILVISIFAPFLLNYVGNFITGHTKIIPINKIEINIGDPRISDKILNSIHTYLKSADAKAMNRYQVLKKVQSILGAAAMIDQYWVRFGLDGNLQITATLQTPILLINGMRGQQVVISNRMKIMALNPSKNDYPDLLNVDAPELEFDNNLSSAMNFPWLISQLSLINSEVAAMGAGLGPGLGFSLSKIAWTSAAGFVLSLSNKTHNLLAYFGTDHIQLKTQRLKDILVTLTAKNTFPTEIDLDYSDKAILKIADNVVSYANIVSK